MSGAAELFDTAGLEVASATVIQRRQRDRAAARRKNLKRMYGISPEQYDAMREAQAYRCAICHRHEDELLVSRAGRPRLDGEPSAEAMKLVVDHDHTTNEVRGLLCHGCNSAIGLFQERADWMANAITYIAADNVCYLRKPAESRAQ